MTTKQGQKTDGAASKDAIKKLLEHLLRRDLSTEVHRNGPGTIYTGGNVGFTVPVSSSVYSDLYLTYRV